MDHTIYRTSDGKILQSGWGIPIERPGTAWVRGIYDDDTHYVTASGEAVPLPERPDEHHVFKRDIGEWVDERSTEEISRDFTERKRRAIEKINALAGVVRRRYLTNIPGQDVLYMMKEAEARAWVSDENHTPGQYPLIEAEIGITGQTGDEVAQIYLNLAHLYISAAAELENGRLGHIYMADSTDVIEGERLDQIVESFAQVLGLDEESALREGSEQ